VAGVDGWASFSEPYVLQQIYLDGTPYDSVAVQIQKAQGLFALQTHAGTDIAQRPYRGADKSADYDKLTFQLSFQAQKQVQWEALKLARAKCSTFYFSFGVPDWAVFNVTSGDHFTMPRYFAYDVIAGVTTGTNPTRIYLNGVLTPSAASFSGRAGTANNTGQIAVHYTAATLAYFTQFPESIPELNNATIQATIEECLQP
jgi:hypothetical protein